MKLLLPFAVGLVLTATPLAAQVSPGQTLEEVVAVVGGDIVLASEVAVIAQQAAQGAAVSDEVWSRALDQIIGQRLVIEAARRDTTISPNEAAVQGQVLRRMNQLTAQLGSETAVEDFFGLSLAQLRTRLATQYREQSIAQQIQQRRLQDVRVTPNEIREWFGAIPPGELPEVPETVRVAHVVLKPEPSAEVVAEARSLAGAIRDSIASGEATIETMAERYSQDPGSAQRGGRYESFDIRELVPEFGAVAARLQPGELSGVFETPFGFHVMRLNERTGDIVDFNHVLIQADEASADPTETIEQLQALRDSIVTGGVPFEAIARRHSDDPLSAQRGGFVTDPRTGERDLRLAGLPDQWAPTLDTLEVGEVSFPTQVQLLDGTQGYHIVLLQRKRPAHQLGYETDYALLEQYALNEKQQLELEAWIGELRERIYVDVRAPRYVAAPSDT